MTTENISLSISTKNVARLGRDRTYHLQLDMHPTGPSRQADCCVNVQSVDSIGSVCSFCIALAGIECLFLLTINLICIQIIL